VLRPAGHVVSEVVEAEFAVLDIRDVAAVHVLTLGGVHVVLNVADRQAQEGVDAPHPLGLPAYEEVVGGDQVRASAFERVEGQRQCGGKGLALTGLHLRDPAFMENRAAHELYVMGTLAQDPAGGLAGQGEGLRQQVIEGLARGTALLELSGLDGEVVIGERLHLGL